MKNTNSIFIFLLIAGIFLFLLGCTNVYVTDQNGITHKILPQKQKILVMGDASLGEKVVLSNMQDVFDVNYVITSPSSFKEYSVILIFPFNQPNKRISSDEADALIQYVNSGGKIIIVMNAGEYYKIGSDGNPETIFSNVAFQVIDWSDLCRKDPSCSMGKTDLIIGKLKAQQSDSPIMGGALTSPPENEPGLQINALDVPIAQDVKSIAYIQSDSSPFTSVGILERAYANAGKMIYFNYDPGLTPGIFSRTLNYLK